MVQRLRKNDFVELATLAGNRAPAKRRVRAVAVGLRAVAMTSPRALVMANIFISLSAPTLAKRTRRLARYIR
jgi:hypothetical protein